MIRSEPMAATGLVFLSILAHAPVPARVSPWTGQSAATLSGVVLTSGDKPAPVRRATVSLLDGISARTATTADDGGFSFSGVPPGRLKLVAAKAGYVSIPYGGTRPGGAGAPLALSPGQVLGGIRLLLARGAVITGTARTPSGEPISDMDIWVARVDGRGPRLMNSPVLTDDRGVFRVFGLAAGAYLVAARPTRMPAETQVESDQAVDKALAELRSRTSPAQMRPTPTSAPSEVAGTVVTWAPVWFPGVVSADLAAQVVVQAGEERSGVDIRVGPVGASSLRGVVTEASGRAIVPQVRIWPVGTLLTGTTPRLVEAPSTSNGDRFQFDNLVPGRYTVLAQARVSGPGLPADPTESSDLEWAITEITAGGGNIEGLELALRASLTVQGRITVEAPHAAEPLDLTGLRVELVRRSGANSAIGPPNPPPATVKAGGTFELRDLLPGSYSLSCAIPPRLTGVLWLRSATSSSADHDLLDEGLSLTADAPAPVTLALTLSDRRSALSGTFFASSGTGPPEDTAIVVFPANSGWWDPFSRRVRMARPATDGHYEFRDLPPGDYYVTAISDPDPDTWSDPATLAQLIASSVRVSIASGEQKTLDLRPAKALH